MASEYRGRNSPSSTPRFSPVSDVDVKSSLSDDDLPLSNLLTDKCRCDSCGLTFKGIKTLRQHVKNYNYAHKYFQCCNIFDKLTHNCQESEASGVSDKYKTEIKTIKKKKRKGRLKKPSNVDNDTVKPYKCQECQASFCKEIGLMTHMRFAHKENFNKCSICDEVFKTTVELLVHTSMHGPEDKIICRNCFAEFSTMKLYRKHAKAYPGPHNFRCNSCLRKFHSESRLEEHTCICINGQPLLCACGLEFSTYSAVVEHAKGIRHLTTFKCCTCDHSSHSLKTHINHIKRHTQQKPFECKTCGLGLACADSLKFHMKNAHGEENYIVPEGMTNSCVTCGAKFDKLSELRRHVNIHEERKSCPDCGKIFRASRLESHRGKHKLSSSLCPECGKLFETHFRLTQHIMTAHSNQAVKCDLCGKVLKTKKILTEHLKTHLKTEIGTRVAQAICPKCGLELAQKGSLARHILLVHERHRLVVDDKPRLCKECGMTLPNKAKYYTHRRQHRAMVERYPCEICNRQFNKKTNLARHMILLHDTKRPIVDPMYTCNLCTRVFRERKNLARHCRLVHKIYVKTY